MTRIWMLQLIPLRVLVHLEEKRRNVRSHPLKLDSVKHQVSSRLCWMDGITAETIQAWEKGKFYIVSTSNFSSHVHFWPAYSFRTYLNYRRMFSHLWNLETQLWTFALSVESQSFRSMNLLEQDSINSRDRHYPFSP